MISHIKSNVLNGELSNRQLCAQKLNESVNKYEDTILHYAVYHKRQELIKFLIKYGANLNKVNKRGLTPMDLAKRYDMETFVNSCASGR